MSDTNTFNASIAANAVDRPIEAAWTISNIATLTLLSSKDLTLKTNSTGTNEKQTLSMTGPPSAGTFTVTLSSQTTAAIVYNATAAIVKAAIEKLTTIGSGNTSCTGGPLPGTPVVIEFVGALAAQNVALATTTDTLTGGSSSITTTTPGVAPGSTIYLIGGRVFEWKAGVDEVQTITITGTPTGGTFTLTFSGQTTSTIAYNAIASAIQSALEALSNIGVGEAICAGGPLPGTPVTVTFQGTLAGAAQPALRASNALTGGTAPAISVAITTQGASYVVNPFTADVTALYATNPSSSVASFSAKVVTT